METLSVPATEFSPAITLDPFTDKYEFRGESRPENARKFFQPVLDWLDKYNQVLFFLKSSKGDEYVKDLEFNFYFDYLNSTSIKFVYDILKKIEALQPNATSIKVFWFFEPGDDDMKENGEELSKMIKLPFVIHEDPKLP
jgi:hypothetical protein